MKFEIVYFYSVTCPWCKTLEPFIRLLEARGYRVVWVCIDVDWGDPLLDLNLFYTRALGMGDDVYIAPLILVRRREFGRIVNTFIPVPGKYEGKKEVEVEVAHMIMMFLSFLKQIGGNYEELLEEEITRKLLKPLKRNAFKRS